MVRTGQVFERLNLTLTYIGQEYALLNQPIEVPELRDQFTEDIGLARLSGQHMLRYVVADSILYSLQRPIATIMT